MAQTPKKVFVDLFYDIVSPYSYLCFEVLTRCNREWPNMDLQLKPVYLGGIMAGTNNVPPATVPNKAKYMHQDLPRLAKYFGVPFNFPEDIANVMFVKGTLPTQRFLTSAKRECPQQLEQLSRELFTRVWFKDEDVTTDESLKEASKKVGLPGKELESVVSALKTAEVKQCLKDTTQTALDHGAFGVPTYVVHLHDGPVMLFGLIRLFLLAQYLGRQLTVESPNDCK